MWPTGFGKEYLRNKDTLYLDREEKSPENNAIPWGSTGEVCTPILMTWDFASTPADAFHSIYLLAKQHMIPVLPRNQQHPTNRINDNAAMVQSKA
jgi:hypothetical protein